MKYDPNRLFADITIYTIMKQQDPINQIIAFSVTAAFIWFTKFDIETQIKKINHKPR